MIHPFSLLLYCTNKGRIANTFGLNVTLSDIEKSSTYMKQLYWHLEFHASPLRWLFLSYTCFFPSAHPLSIHIDNLFFHYLFTTQNSRECLIKRWFGMMMNCLMKARTKERNPPTWYFNLTQRAFVISQMELNQSSCSEFYKAKGEVIPVQNPIKINISIALLFMNWIPQV